MKQLSSYDEQRIIHQFDRLCQIILEGEVANYCRSLDNILPEHESGKFYIMDEYFAEKEIFSCTYI